MLRSHSQSLVWPAVIDPKQAQAFAYLSQLERSQWMKPERLRRLQAAQLALRLRHAAATSAFFGPRLQGREIDQRTAFDVLGTLPVLTRADMQGSGDGIYCEPPKDHGTVKVLRTSGSTGQPVAVRCTAACFSLRGAATMRSLGWRGLDIRKSFAAIRASIKTGTVDNPLRYRGWGAHLSALFHTGPAIGLPINVPVSGQLEFLDRYKPAYLLTYPSNLRALVDNAPTRPAGLECVMTIGETLSDDLRADIQARWDVPLFDEYSSEEMGPIAAQCPHGNYHCTAEALVVEVLDDQGRPCQPGEIGRVVITDFANFATAMLRYEIRDYAEVGEPCACKRTLPVLKRIVGRERNLMQLRDGSRFWPQFGMRDPQATRLVKQYQIIQTSLDRLEMKVVADHPLTGDERTWITTLVRERLRHPFDVVIEQVEGEIPKGPNGKFHEFMCMVGA
ncbi:AMP-binding protein [Emcibacter sp. SYSU 3D8]|uniref:phenylacetate--CoA ligase family protein n=1 Tax=Emcibacter sp. SYSU 3D8 TaxID=3133969 RepID=UPI0031FE8AF8